MTPTVSVIIPTHNRASMVREAIESVRQQTYPDWELIVVDDGSTDGTKAAVEEAARQDARIQYVWKPQGGVSTARNLGLQSAKGRYLAFLDDDDLLLPERLAVQLEHLERHPEFGFLYGQVEIVNKEGLVTAIEPIVPVLTMDELLDRGGIRIQSVLCRREWVERVGGFDERLTLSEDYDLWLRLAAVTRFGFLPKRVVRYRVHGANACNDGIRIYRERSIALRKVKLNPAGGITFWRRRRRIGINEYRLARLHRDHAQYGRAAQHFALAMLAYPLIGLEMTEPKPQGWRRYWAVIKPLAAILVCAAKMGSDSVFPMAIPERNRTVPNVSPQSPHSR